MVEPFKVGDLVRLRGSFTPEPSQKSFKTVTLSRLTGIFEVTACLPDGQYRLKGGEPRHERIISGDQILPASKPQPTQ
jgi:hypothetical protein